MLDTLRPLHTDDQALDPRTRILDAAETCFVVHGFHRTTMQLVASAAQMSVGNLYRYFPAKDAIVLGLAERDRAEAAEQMARPACDDELWATLKQVVREHLVDAPREKAVLSVEIWAEVTRNPKLAEMQCRFDGENRAWLVDVLTRVARKPLDVEELASLLLRQFTGILVHRALLPDYNPAPDIDSIMAVAEARLFGEGWPVPTAGA